MTGIPSGVGQLVAGQLITMALVCFAAGGFGIWLGRCEPDTYIGLIQWCSYIGGIVTVIFGAIYLLIGLKVASS